MTLLNTMNTVYLGLHIADTPLGINWPARRNGGMVTLIDSLFANITNGTAILSPASSDLNDDAGAKNAFVAPFYTKNDHFTKTGSGQT